MVPTSATTIVPIIIATTLFSNWRLARRKSALEQELRQLLQSAFPSITLIAVDQKNIAIRFQGRTYTFPVQAFYKELEKRSHDIFPLLETALVQATRQTLTELKVKNAEVAMTMDTLQFEKAQITGAPQDLRCITCLSPISNHYFEVNGHASCDSCKDKLSAAFSRKIEWMSVWRSILYGSGAAILGCVIYYEVRAITGYELGLIAIVVGLMIGGAVRKGSGGRGGPLFQTIAMFLTYSAIVFTYTPDLVKVIRARVTKPPQAAVIAAPTTKNIPPKESAPNKQPSPPPSVQDPKPSPAPQSRMHPFVKKLSQLPKPVRVATGLVALIGLLFAIPFLSGLQNLMGLAIISFALYEAWKLNKRTVLKIDGPFRLGTVPDPPQASPQAGS